MYSYHTKYVFTFVVSKGFGALGYNCDRALGSNALGPVFDALYHNSYIHEIDHNQENSFKTE